jgi:beta-lactamase class A
VKTSLFTGLLALAMIVTGVASCSSTPRDVGAATQPSQNPPTDQAETPDPELTKQLRSLCEGVAGDIGVAVIHVESGRTVEFEGARKLPLYSVFKLPLAVTVLKKVEAGRLQLDKKIEVTPADVAPGSKFNTDLWRTAQEKTVAELLEFAIVRSDNTSADKLLPLVGGPATVTQQMRTLGLSNIDISVTTREFLAHRDKPNLGTATDLARLLTQLQRGDLLQPTHLALLLGYMKRSRTGGERRLRAALPAGTQVADKTGAGEFTTNDVGLVTLPDNKGHLAIAVLINGSKLPIDKQEKTIADIARAAYDSFVAQPASR